MSIPSGVTFELESALGAFDLFVLGPGDGDLEFVLRPLVHLLDLALSEILTMLLTISLDPPVP